MSMCMRSFVFAFALAFFLDLAAAQTQVKEERASSKKVEETVSKLLSVPMYTAEDEKVLNETGDGAAVVIAKIVSKEQMNAPETGRRILLILHLAFEAPQSISKQNRMPVTALRLLDQLATEYGRQSNAIDNARFEIKHNTSSGEPLKFVTFPEQPVIDWGHNQWLGDVLLWTATIKPGMTRTDLLRVYGIEGGLSTRTQQTYVLKQCPTIKVDVQFSISEKESNDKIIKISQPYLDYGHYD